VPDTPQDQARIRDDIKALANEGKRMLDQLNDAPGPQTYVSGFLGGLLVAGRLVDGDSAEKALEFFEDQLNAWIGKAYLEGKLPAPNAPAEG
jgi:hypothetical protein